jgi:hypothetical protein
VNEIAEFLKVLVGAPQVQGWLGVGVIAGIAYGYFRYKRLTEFFVTTVIVVLPLLVLLVSGALYGGNTNSLWFLPLLILMIPLVMFGLAGFSAGWLPGVLFGSLLGYIIDRNRIDGRNTL